MATLRQVENGSASLASGNSSVDVTLATTLLDTARAFVVCGMQPGSNSPQTGFVTAQIINTTTVRFARNATGVTITIEWYVAEFTAGVTVQRGSTLMTSQTRDVTITAVDTTKAFSIITLRNVGNITNADDFATAAITSTTNLRLNVVTSNGAGSSQTVEWQVIEYDACSVQAGSVAFAAGDLVQTATINAIDLTQSWLILSLSSADGTTANIGQKLIRGDITNTTTLTFTRASSGQALTVQYFLVEFTDATLVQPIVVNFGTGDTQIDSLITAITTSKTFVTAAGLYNRSGSANYTADDDTSPATFTLDLTGSTNLRSIRSITGSVAAVLSAFVVTFDAVLISAAGTVSARDADYHSAVSHIELTSRARVRDTSVHNVEARDKDGA